MKIAVIQASSQASKNEMLFSIVRKHADGHRVINFGCREDEAQQYSYIEISLLIGLLLNSEAVDFVVTGCSSGQGMMLACNSLPNVLCGYAPSPRDGYLFVQINDGNAVSLPLGEDYAWIGYDNFDKTLAAIFSEPFGQGYPKEEAERKLRDTAQLKKIRRDGQVDILEFLNTLDQETVAKLLSKRDVIDYINEYGNEKIKGWVNSREESGKPDGSDPVMSFYLDD